MRDLSIFPPTHPFVERISFTLNLARFDLLVVSCADRPFEVVTAENDYRLMNDFFSFAAEEVSDFSEKFNDISKYTIDSPSINQTRL